MSFEGGQVPGTGSRLSTWTWQTERLIQWLADGKPIDGATEEIYTPTEDVAGKLLSVRVTTGGPILGGRVGDYMVSKAIEVPGGEWIPSAESSLELGKVLNKGQKLVSGNDIYELVVEESGDVVFYGDGVPKWHLATSGSTQLFLTAQGRLLAVRTDPLEGGGGQKWGSPAAAPEYEGVQWAVVTNDGSLVLTRGDYRVASNVVWDSADPRWWAKVTSAGVVPSAPRVGDVVTATGGVPSPPHAGQAYQWWCAGKPLTGATQASYTVGTMCQDLMVSVTPIIASGNNVSPYVFSKPVAVAPWVSTGKSSLGLGDVLNKGQKLTSENGIYKLVVEETGDVVFYGDGVPKWHLATSGSTQLILTAQGRLLAVRTDPLEGGGGQKWGSPAAAPENEGVQQAVVTNDGSLVLTRGDYHVASNVVWDSADPKWWAKVTSVGVVPAAPRVGDVVTATGGVPSPPHAGQAYQWWCAGKPLTGVTQASYTAGTVCQDLKVSVTPIIASGNNVSPYVYSDPTPVLS